MIGSKVVVKCSAEGTPEPSITWRVNGVPLHGGSQCRAVVLDQERGTGLVWFGLIETPLGCSGLA